ncbi:MAG TPA: M48 family metalloprotease [Thermoanaerobaculia bacterium]|jgi:Zn-dependent protease with chaperone function|nr:M48 family metalloprotease [Thermoanaerobaculia bacterium]
MRLRAMVAVYLFTLAAAPLMAAKPDEEMRSFDAHLSEELRAVDPGAVLLLEQANRERYAEDHASAARDYVALAARVPKFDHAFRRASGEEAAVGHSADALRLARQALDVRRSAMNLAVVALATLAPDLHPGDAEKTAATEMVTEGLRETPMDQGTAFMLAEVALRLGSSDLTAQAANRLAAVAPRSWEVHYLRAFAIGNQGNLSAGKDELEQAHALGMPDDAFRATMDAFDAARPLYQKVLIGGAYVLIPWLFALALIFGAGELLSRAALRASAELPTDPTVSPAGFGRRLRRIYAALIAFSSVYYYISIPIVVLLTLGLAAGIIFGMLAAGWISGQLIVIAFILGFVTLVSVTKGFFKRVPNLDPGETLDLSAHPALRACIDDVAGTIGTRPVDKVYLTPGTDVAVMERGGMLKRSPERCLILGVGVLEGFTMRPFRAVLAHEYGHLINRDTAGGRMAISVRNTLMRSAIHIAQSGAAAWYSPTWQFLKLFNKVFLRVSHGASRFQEAMADRWATFAYGSAAFESGLNHVVLRSIDFRAHANATLSEAISQKKAVVNIYSFQPQEAWRPEEIAEEKRKAITDDESPFDSHPSYAKRIAWASTHDTPGEAPRLDDAEPVWSLFSDRDAVEHTMTEVVRMNVRTERGIDITHL